MVARSLWRGRGEQVEHRGLLGWWHHSVSYRQETHTRGHWSKTMNVHHQVWTWMWAVALGWLWCLSVDLLVVKRDSRPQAQMITIGKVGVGGKSLAVAHFCYARKTTLNIKSKTHHHNTIIITHCLNLPCFSANSQKPFNLGTGNNSWLPLCSIHFLGGLCFVLFCSEMGSHVAQADHRTSCVMENDLELLTLLSPRAGTTCRSSNPPTFYMGTGAHAYVPPEPSPQPDRRHFNE